MVKYFGMYIDTDGIVLRQTKTVNGRRMILLFTKQYGKISAGTSLSERGKNKTALALRPFTLGRYELFKGRESYSINGAETLNGFYSIGEDVDRFMAASYILELISEMLPEEQPAPELFDMLIDYFELLQARKTAFGTLIAGFQTKALRLAGSEPETERCTVCGSEKDLRAFSVRHGGTVCGKCADEIDLHGDAFFRLAGEDLDVLRFLKKGSLRTLEQLALKPDTEKFLRRLLKAWYAWQLGIEDLKSEWLNL